MNEALILEKLDRLSDEVRTLKSDVLAELRQEIAPLLNQTRSGETGLISTGLMRVIPTRKCSR